MGAIYRANIGRSFDGMSTVPRRGSIKIDRQVFLPHTNAHRSRKHVRILIAGAYKRPTTLASILLRNAQEQPEAILPSNGNFFTPEEDPIEFVELCDVGGLLCGVGGVGGLWCGVGGVCELCGVWSWWVAVWCVVGRFLFYIFIHYSVAYHTLNNVNGIFHNVS